MCEEATKVLLKYPDRIPVIVKSAKNNKLPALDKHKFLVPSDVTVGQFVYIIRKRINVESNEAIFLFINNILPPTASLMSHMYETHKDEDGFLYVTYNSENTFGTIN